jgi:hypothetical protein
MKTSDWRDEFVTPAGLERSAPRPVKLSRRGRFVFCLAIGFIGGAVASGLGLGSIAARGVAETQQFSGEGAVTEGVVTAKWQTRGDSPKRWIAYRFDAPGGTYQGRARMQRQAWRGLEPGADVMVIYLPGAPQKNRPDGAEPSDMPPWVPVLVSGQFAGVAVFLLWQIGRQRRLLEEGRVSQGIVTEHGKMARSSHGRQVGRKFKYRFALLSGSTAEGKGGPEMVPPPLGASIAVLYDRDNPRRNAPYPLAMVQVDRT